MLSACSPFLSLSIINSYIINKPHTYANTHAYNTAHPTHVPYFESQVICACIFIPINKLLFTKNLFFSFFKMEFKINNHLHGAFSRRYINSNSNNPMIILLMLNLSVSYLLATTTTTVPFYTCSTMSRVSNYLF